MSTFMIICGIVGYLIIGFVWAKYHFCRHIEKFIFKSEYYFSSLAREEESNAELCRGITFLFWLIILILYLLFIILYAILFLIYRAIKTFLGLLRFLGKKINGERGVKNENR